VERWASSFVSQVIPPQVARRGCSEVNRTRLHQTRSSKKCYNFKLAMCTPRPAYCISTEQPRYYLLLTGIHRLLAPLFTSIRILFETSTLRHCHDSIETWNSARLA